MKIIIILFMLLSTTWTVHTQASQQIFEDLDVQTKQSASLKGFDTFINVVIFIRFNDEINYVEPLTLLEYEDMFNKENDISLRDFYLEASYGQLTIQSLLFSDDSNLIIYYTDIYDRAFYEPKSLLNPSGYDEDDFNQIANREHGLLKRAIQFIDALDLIDESINLDVNDDGDIDSLTFMISGEDNGWGSFFWPHQWYLYTHYDDIDAPSINGFKAYTYTFNLLGNSRDYYFSASVGVLAHETFHLLGAPDLYHYDGYRYIANAGPWALMDSSNPIPVHMLGYMKFMYGGWMDAVTTITEEGRYTLGPLKDSPNHLLRFDTGYSNEYVYFEFRYQEGKYESTLPGEGLLVYRVDKDFYGNQDGYSDTSNGPGINEVFVFRPFIQDTIEPITFPEDPLDDDFDGEILSAALSQFNLFDEANLHNDFIFFHSDGTRMQLRVTEVVMFENTISFNVSFEQIISATLEVGGYALTENDFLFNHSSFTYEGKLLGVDLYDVYVSLDGDVATLNDVMYDTSFNFNSQFDVIHLAFYQNGVRLGEQIISIPFVENIESAHFPYGNDVYIAWYIPYIENLEKLTLTFNHLFELEEDYDFLYITTSNQEWSYTHTSLRNQVVDLTAFNEGIWIELITDESYDDLYGVFATLQVQLINTQVTYSEYIKLDGLPYVEIPFGVPYVEQGLEFLEPYASAFTFTVTSEVNSLIPGLYDIVYEIYESNVMVYTLKREVVVLNPFEVSFDLIEDQQIELGSMTFSFETLVLNVTSNSVYYEIEVTHSIDFNSVGFYDIEVKVVDMFGFESIQTLTLHIIDTTKPIIFIHKGVDTIVFGQTFIDSGVSMIDLDDLRLEVEHNISSQSVGRYVITYRAFDVSLNMSEAYRVVHVIESDMIFIEIEDSITTFTFGEPVTIPKCMIASNTKAVCQVDADFNAIQQIGTHVITYQYTSMGVTTKRIWYIFVLPQAFVQPILMMPEKERDTI